ncbi:UNVERIFIED_ORG: hypothetical protein GGD51_004178 [Rhizobium esperanzae]
MTHKTNEDQKAALSQADIDTWRILKKALRTGLSDRGFKIEAEEASLVARFMLEQIETCGLRVVPVKPTTEMQHAIKQALDQGKRMSVGWVKPRTKQRWRYQAAIDAAPSWRRGYLLDQGADDGQPKP